MADPGGKKRKWIRRAIIALSVLAIVLLVVALLIPYAVKRYVEKHSIEWIDRKVTIDELMLNPFTLRYAVNGVSVSEVDKEQVFVSWRSISLKTDVWDALQNDDWRFWDVRCEEPYFHITQSGERFNFSDLLELGDSDPPEDSSSTRFSMTAIQLNGGRIVYGSDILRSPVEITDLNAVCSSISSEESIMDFMVGLRIASGGEVSGGFRIDTESNGYGIDAALRNFNVAPLKPYLDEFFDCGAFEGAVDVELHLQDSFDDTTSLAMSVDMELANGRLTDPNGLPLIKCARAHASMDTLAAEQQLLKIGEIVVEGPEIHFTLLDAETDNWTRLLKLDSTVVDGDTTISIAASESNVFLLLADYIATLAEHVITNQYSANTISISNGSIHFEDNIPAQPFRYKLTDASLSTKRVTTDETASTIKASATLNETGTVRSTFVFDPNKIQNVNMEVQVDQLDLNHLDPYGRWYAAHPFVDGLLDLVSVTSIMDGKIDSQNSLRIAKLEIGKKVKEHDPETIVLPLRLAAGLLKDKNGLVDLDIPVTGDLNDPKFRPWPIVWNILKDLMAKAVSAPGNLLAKQMKDTDPSDLERIRFAYLQNKISKPQEKTLSKLVSALENKPELMVTLIPTVDSLSEAKEYAVLQVKKRFLFPEKETLNTTDSTRLFDHNQRDSSFVSFVDGLTSELDGYSLHDRCLHLAGKDNCLERVKRLEQDRLASVQRTLIDLGLDKDRYKVRKGTDSELQGQLGVPGYRFVYSVEDVRADQEQ